MDRHDTQRVSVPVIGPSRWGHAEIKTTEDFWSAGEDEVRELLEALGVEDDKRYRSVLGK